MNSFDREMTERLERAITRHPRPLLFATISGAHLYGFPSPDSDYDLRGVHLLGLEEVLALDDPPETLESTTIDEGVEMDVVTHDAHKFFRLLLRPNGYVLEQLMSPLIVRTNGYHEELRALAPAIVTRRHAHHYRGFFLNQWKFIEREPEPRVKPLLYAYRVLLTGIHLMRTGKVEANLTMLKDDANCKFLNDLISLKIHGAEKEKLPLLDLEFHRSKCFGLLETLEEESQRSYLPEAPSARKALSDLLVRVRLASRSPSP